MSRIKTGLSPRELQVMRCMASGKTRLQAADELGISRHTLSAHLCRIYHYLGASNLVDAIHKSAGP